MDERKKIKQHISRAERKKSRNIKHMRLRPDYRVAAEEYYRAAQTSARSNQGWDEWMSLMLKSSEFFGSAKDFLRSGKVAEQILDSLIKRKSRGEEISVENLGHVFSLARYVEYCYMKNSQVDDAADLLHRCGSLLIDSGFDESSGVTLQLQSIQLLEAEKRPYQATIFTYNSLKQLSKEKRHHGYMDRYIKFGLRISSKLENNNLLGLFAVLACLLGLADEVDDSMKNRLSADHIKLIRNRPEAIASLRENCLEHLVGKGLNEDFTAEVEEALNEEPNESEEQSEEQAASTSNNNKRSNKGKVGAAAAVAVVAVNTALIASKVGGSRKEAGTRRQGKKEEPGGEPWFGSPFGGVHADITGYQHIQPDTIGMTDSQFREMRRFSYIDEESGNQEGFLEN